jgi:hypothetical protein
VEAVDELEAERDREAEDEEGERAPLGPGE